MIKKKPLNSISGTPQESFQIDNHSNLDPAILREGGEGKKGKNVTYYMYLLLHIADFHIANYRFFNFFISFLKLLTLSHK